MESVAITPGSGALIAVDTLADGNDVQYIKILDATADSIYGLVIDSGGAARVVRKGAPNGTPTTVPAALTSTALLGANAARRGATIFNDSTANLYVLLGSGTVSATSFTVKLPAGGYYEVPFDYTGAINGIWDAAAGNARVTEIT